MDRDGYPEDDELQRIREWDWKDPYGLADYIATLWYYPDFWHREGHKIEAHTGGWSGNESIIEALQQNEMWWLWCWWSSRRGGHYEFKLPEEPIDAPTDSKPIHSGKE